MACMYSNEKTHKNVVVYDKNAANDSKGIVWKGAWQKNLDGSYTFDMSHGSEAVANIPR